MTERWAPASTTVVTGAAGWLGRALLHRLAGDRQRHRLRLLVRDEAEERLVTPILEASSARVRVVRGDIAALHDEREVVLKRGAEAVARRARATGIVERKELRSG